MCKRNFSKPGVNRLVQSKRMLTVAALVAGGRCKSMRINTITEKLNERTGDTWHERTIRRDLHGLVEMGLVTPIKLDLGARGTQPTEFRWSGDADMTRMMIDGHRQSRSEQPTPPETLQAILSTIPEPWEIDDTQRAIATSVARLAAVMQTGDRRYLKAELAFKMGVGWMLPIEAELNAFDRAYRIEDIAARCEHEAETMVPA